MNQSLSQQSALESLVLCQPQLLLVFWNVSVWNVREGSVETSVLIYMLTTALNYFHNEMI